MLNGSRPRAKPQCYRALVRTGGFAMCALAAGCSGRAETPKASVEAPSAAAPASVVHPARLFVLPELQPQATRVAELADGTRQVVARGVRLLDRVDGSLERARDVLPGRGTPRAIELPERLGGGYLFAVEGSGATDLWRAGSFTGPLKALARLDFEVEQLVPGFDRLYLIERRSRDVSAVDVDSGRMLDLGPLPAAPGYASLAFPNAWFGAVQVPLRGAMLSFDAGASWNVLPVSSAGPLGIDSGEVTVTTAEGALAVDEAGVVRPFVAPSAAPAPESTARVPEPRSQRPAEDAARVAYGVLGRRPLIDAVLHGVVDAPGTAVVAANGALARVRLSDGKLLEARERAYPGTSTCHGVPLEAGHGFVCGEEGSNTVVYRLRSFALEPVLVYEGARLVSASGNGALVVQGPCGARAPTRAQGGFCVRSRAGLVREIALPGELGIERVVALSDGRVAVLEPPRAGVPGALTVISAAGARSRVPLRLPRTPRAAQALLRKGLWLNGFVEGRPGELLGWVAAAGPFAGVRVHLDGRVEAAPPEQSIDRALLAGPLGIVFGGPALAAQTIDHGFTWREVELPSDSLGDDASRRSELARREQGCSPLGCVFGPWLRVGWHAQREDTALPLAASPPRVSRISPGGGRWQLRCAPTGEVLRGPRGAPEETERSEDFATTPLGSSARQKRSASSEAAPGGVWPGLFELAAPARATAEPAFHTGTEHKAVQVHGYTWSARGTNWDRGGKWQLYVADPFRVRGAWSTLATRSPWPDASVAAQAFGADSSGSSNWDAALDPLGRAGALAINSRGTLELFLFEEEQGIAPVREAGRLGFFSLAGVVKLGSAWFVGAEAGSQTFRILRIEGGRVNVLAEYPLYQLGRAGLRASVVRSSSGNRLGIWVRSGGWYVFPVSPGSGALSAPLELRPAELARPPRACTADAEGWLLKTQPSETSRDLLEPNVDAGDTRLRNLEARLIVSATGTCLDALAAQADRSRVAIKKNEAAIDRLSAPLVVSERRVGGQRWGFRCAP